MFPPGASSAVRARVAAFCSLLSLVAAAATLHAQGYTAADLPGPDGIVYPDWRAAGVPGGIPSNLVVRATISAAQNTDIAAQLESAAVTAAAAGGGVVVIPSGTYYLSRPVLIRQSNVVFRGSSGGTTLRFTFQAPVNDVRFFTNPAGVTTLYNNTFIQAHADPVGLRKIGIYAKAADGTLLTCAEQVKATGTWGNVFSITTNGNAIRGKVGTGLKEVVARAEYDDNHVLTRTVAYTIQNSSDANAVPSPSLLGALSFCGVGSNTGNLLITQNVARGAKTVQLNSGHGLLAGDLVTIHAPRTPTWDAQTQNACVTSDLFRMGMYQIASVTATSVTFTQPVRIDYPMADGPDATGAYLKRNLPVKRCGVENLTLQQDYDVWTCGIVFSWGQECWVKNVTVKKAGRMPIYCSPGKNCEVRNVVLNDAWYKGEGGTGYCSFERAYDCLMDGLTTYELRHAPLVQWSAAGNVIRNGTFYDSDAQWHAGWANENLFENCTVLSNRGNGGYGYGMWASPPDDTLHGPNGPSNVVYNCDVTSPMAGAWLGGMNRGWVFLHNRFVVDSGPGIFAQKSSGDHIIENNVLLLRDPAAGIELADADCNNVEVVKNQFRGNLTSADAAVGAVVPSVQTQNTVSDTLTPVSFANPGFENDLTGWNLTGDNNMSVVNVQAARTGSKGVRVTDTSTTAGSYLITPAFAVTPGKVYVGRMACRGISGANAAGFYMNFYRADGSQSPRSAVANIKGSPYWRRLQVIETAPLDAVTAKLQVHTYNAGLQTFDVDDFSFGEMPLDVPNTGFEWGTETWDLTGDGGMSTAVAAAKQSGNLGLRVTDASTNAGSWASTPKVPCIAGTTYQVRFWSRILSGSGIGVYLVFYDAGNNTVGGTTLLEVPVNAEWTENLLRVAAPAGAVKVRVQIHSYMAAQVTADFDNFTFLELPARPVPSVSSIFDWQRNPVFPLNNADFDNGLTGWDANGDGGMSTATTGAAHDAGGTGLHVVDTATGAGSSLKSPLFPVAEGFTYRTDFWAYTRSGSGIGVYLVFVDAQGNQVGTSAVRDISSATGGWTAFNLSAQAPAGAASAYLWVHSYIAAVVTADLDDFTFKAVWN